MTSTVELLIYDVLKNRGYGEKTRFGVVASTSGAGRKIAHLSVAVRFSEGGNEEYEYGDGGISISFEPGSQDNLIDRVSLGPTKKSPFEIRQYVMKLQSDKFTKAKYDAGTNNCVYFVDELCQFLLGKRVPIEYLEAIHHPLVQLFCLLTRTNKPKFSQMISEIPKPAAAVDTDNSEVNDYCDQAETVSHSAASSSCHLL